MGGGRYEVDVHHGDEAENQEQRKKAPLTGAPNVEVVLGHFPRHCYKSSLAMVLCLKRALASWLLARDGHGEHSDLRGSGHWSITPYVHGRRELYFSSLALSVCA
jgi:hypothetical protein